MSIRTYNQLNDDEKLQAKKATQDRFLMYLHSNGIPQDRTLWPINPPEPFTKVSNAGALNEQVQELQGAHGAIYWVGEFLADPVLSAALEDELDVLVQELRFRSDDTPPEDVIPLS